MAYVIKYAKALSRILWQRATHTRDPTQVVSPERSTLAVVMHGLNGSPADMRTYTEHLEEWCAVYCPAIRYGGNMSCKATAATVWPVIEEHLTKHPDALVVLVGLSNGGRLAAQLDLWLRIHSPQTRAVVYTIVCPFKGTFMINLLGRLGEYTGVYSRRVYEEMRYDSAVARELVQALQAPLPPSCRRKYILVAAKRDLIVVPYCSALPKLGHGETTITLEDDTHVTAVLSDCPKLCQLIRDAAAQLKTE